MVNDLTSYGLITLIIERDWINSNLPCSLTPPDIDESLRKRFPLPRFKIVDTRFSKSTFPGNRSINYQIVQFRNNPDITPTRVRESRYNTGEGRVEVEEGELRQALVARSNENLKFRATGRGRGKIYRPASYFSIEGGGSFAKLLLVEERLKFLHRVEIGRPPECSKNIFFFFFARYTKETRAIDSFNNQRTTSMRVSTRLSHFLSLENFSSFFFFLFTASISGKMSFLSTF